MMVGDLLRELREQKKLSQGDIEERTGLLRCYISRVENGHTVPAVETLEKFARALEVPLYQLFYEWETRPVVPELLRSTPNDGFANGRGARYWSKLRRMLAKMNEKDRKLLLHFAGKSAALNRLRKLT
jgi:transcriptional regulator with XRE-family HTH domain